ncbi:MAG: hypothetical protein MI920_21895 [Kiloniellales bacterium]|nr:hypothetical protein [Kiloniellales bacterium]
MNLAVLRDDRSKEEIARRAGLSLDRFEALLGGEELPGPAEIWRIAWAFDRDPAEFFPDCHLSDISGDVFELRQRLHRVNHELRRANKNDS